MTDGKQQDGKEEVLVEKTAKQLEKEAKNAAKLAKFQEKQAKIAAQPAAAPKEKVEVSFIKCWLF